MQELITVPWGHSTSTWETELERASNLMKLPGGTATSYAGHSSKPGRVSPARARHPVFTGRTGLRLMDSRALCCLGPTNLNSEAAKSVCTGVQVYRKPRVEISTEAKDTEANTLSFQGDGDNSLP